MFHRNVSTKLFKYMTFHNGMESAAASILTRAVAKDKEEQYTESLILYQEGLQILFNSIAETKNALKKKYFRDKAEEYMKRAEYIKKLINDRKKLGKYREQMKIEAGSIGHGYESLFGPISDASVIHVHIEDPYIRAYHQCLNLVRLCELVVHKCQTISKISLVTTKDIEDGKSQSTLFIELKKSLASQLINFEVTFSDTLHDRQISFSNGWIIKIGRGLDYFKPPDGQFVIGSCNLELRPCLETTVDIFHSSHLISHS